MNSLQNNNFKDQNYMNPEHELTLKDYIVILRIHFKKIILFTIIGTLFGIYHTNTIPPNYKATASLMIREKPGANMIMDISGNRSNNRMINIIEVIRSRALAKEVVKKLWNSNRRNNLHVFGTRKFYPRGQKIRQGLKEIVTLGLYDPTSYAPKRFQEDYDESIGDRFANNIISGLNVNNIRNTNIIEITFNSVNADEAKRIANIIARTYVKMDREWSSENAAKSVEFLKSLVNEQEKNIENSDKKTRDFMLNNSMFSLDGDANSIIDQLNKHESDIYNIRSEINIRKEKIDLLNSRLTEEEKSLTDQLMNNINSKVINLNVQIGRLESQIIQNSSIYGNEHGAVIELKEKLAILKNDLDKKVALLLSQGITVQDPLKARQDMITDLLTIDSEIISLELREAETNKMLKLFNNKLNDLPEKQMQLARLNRDTEVLKENYSFLRKKLEEAKLNVAIKVGDAQFLDSARRPSNPSSPNHRKNILSGLGLGLGLGILLALLIEFLDNTLKTIDEIEKYNLSVLGIIPSIGGEVVRNFNKFNFFKNSKPINTSKKLKRRLITKEDPKSPVSESYRSLRTSMLYSSDKEVKSILISSAGPGEGKTTTVANLAITYANLGKKTLLIDTDLRRPVVHKVFNLNREPGVTNFLSGQESKIDKLLNKTDIDNLYVMTSGIIPPNPSEMLGSNRMVELVRTLEEGWDIVLFDSPPLVAVTDANMISKEIDTIVLVVKVGQTDKKAFHHTIANLKNIQAPLGGIIMNAVTSKSSYGSYYYYYYHQYYHYYGSDKESV